MTDWKAIGKEKQEKYETTVKLKNYKKERLYL